MLIFEKRSKYFLLAGFAVVVSSTGCQVAFHEAHYFASRDKTTGAPINYYRVSVDGCVVGSDARYVSGYFDPMALEAYFGEFSQPDEATFLSRAPTRPGDREIEAVDPTGRSRQLVMILSSNSDKVANEIGAIAQGEALAGMVASLIVPESATEAGEAHEALRLNRLTLSALASLGDEMITPLDPEASPERIRANLLAFINQTARQLGATRDFQTFDEARLWVVQYRASKGGIR